MVPVISCITSASLFISYIYHYIGIHIPIWIKLFLHIQNGKITASLSINILRKWNIFSELWLPQWIMQINVASKSLWPPLRLSVMPWWVLSEHMKSPPCHQSSPRFGEGKCFKGLSCISVQCRPPSTCQWLVTELGSSNVVNKAKHSAKCVRSIEEALWG